MTEEQAKQLLPIIKAFSEGKIIQLLDDKKGKWEDMPKNKDIDFEDIAAFAVSCRIKTKATYRPFANAEECWHEMQKHQPFGWLKYKNECFYTNIKSLGDKDILLTHDVIRNYPYIYKNYIFADGTPFGMKVEDS